MGDAAVEQEGGEQRRREEISAAGAGAEVDEGEQQEKAREPELCLACGMKLKLLAWHAEHWR